MSDEPQNEHLNGAPPPGDGAKHEGPSPGDSAKNEGPPPGDSAKNEGPPPVPNPSAEIGLTDGLQLWQAEAAPTNVAPIGVFRLDANEKLLIPFTTAVERCTLHWVGVASLPGYIHCNGDGCVLCRIGKAPAPRDLWPVYDVENHTVAVLPIAPNQLPDALRPQLMPILRQLAETQARVLVVVAKNNYAFAVHTLPLPEGVDDGAAAIARFLQQLESGAVKLTSVFPRKTNAELKAVPEVARQLKLRGLGA